MRHDSVIVATVGLDATSTALLFAIAPLAGLVELGKLRRHDHLSKLSIGSKVVPFYGSYLECYKLIPERVQGGLGSLASVCQGFLAASGVVSI